MSFFTVNKSSQSFIKPSGHTPSVTLALSPIDLVPGLRHAVRSLHVFRHGLKPADVLRSALSKTLVKYYPFAGRFVGSYDRGDVQVMCNGEGAWFVEATADCSLEDVNYLDHPMMISPDNLLPDPRPEMQPTDLPFMMQVTEFRCGGFVVGIMSVHTIADGFGAVQFVNAIAETARGLHAPTVEPVWSREVIPSPRNLHFNPSPPPPSLKLQYSAAYLSLDRIKELKNKYFESTSQICSTFDVAIAHAWRSRTRAIKLDPEATVRLCFFASVRHLLREVLPQRGGYYGNCFYPVTITATAAEIVDAELIGIVKVIRDAKLRLSGEFEDWANGICKENPYELTIDYNSLFVSDWTKLGFADVDYGWGKPVHVIPFAYYDFMAVAILGSPLPPRDGARLMMQCVKEEHLEALDHEMMNFS